MVKIFSQIQEDQAVKARNNLGKPSLRQNKKWDRDTGWETALAVETDVPSSESGRAKLEARSYI